MGCIDSSCKFKTYELEKIKNAIIFFAFIIKIRNTLVQWQSEKWQKAN